MELILPQLGLFVWTVVIFLALFFLMKSTVWKQILAAIDERNKGIESSLQAAAEAEVRLQGLTSQNEKLLQEARSEQARILAEATKIKNDTIEAARKEANEQKDKILAAARQQITMEKNAAVAEIKSLASTLALELAEKVLRRQLDNKADNQRFVAELVKDVKLN